MHSTIREMQSSPRTKSQATRWWAIVLVLTPVGVEAALLVPRLINWIPVWAWYADPGYQYLFAGASLITGGTTDLVYHPGTPLQWIVGLTEVGTHMAVGNSSLLEDIADRPELYAQTSGVVLAVMFVAALAAAALRLLKFLGLVPALAFQLVILWGLPLVAAGRFVLWPESVILTALIALLAVLAPQLGGHSPSNSGLQSIGLGLLCAIGITTKVTFAPVILVVALLLWSRRVAVFLAVLLAGSAVILIPVYSRFPFMADWLFRISTRPGRHGQTGEWSPLGNFVQSMLLLNAVVRWFLPVVALILVLSALGVFLSRPFHPKRFLPEISIWSGSLVIVLAGLKDSETRDFILVLPLLATAMSVAVTRITSHLKPAASRWFSGGSLALLSILAAHGVVQEEYFHRSVSTQSQATVEKARTIQDWNQDALWVSAYNTWTPIGARVFGLMWSAGTLNQEVRELGPQSVYFDLFFDRILYVDEQQKLVSLTCQEMAALVAEPGLGLVVESQGHLRFDESRSRIQLETASASYQGPFSIGDYFAFRLTDISCSGDDAQ